MVKFVIAMEYIFVTFRKFNRISEGSLQKVISLIGHNGIQIIMVKL